MKVSSLIWPSATLFFDSVNLNAAKPSLSKQGYKFRRTEMMGLVEYLIGARVSGKVCVFLANDGGVNFIEPGILVVDRV